MATPGVFQGHCILASNKVKIREATVHISINKEESVSFKLKSNDTPGIGDSQGRSKQFLN